MTSSVASVPDTAFLQPDDVPGQIKGIPVRLAHDKRPLPSFCGAAHDQGDRLVARATFRLLYNSPGSAVESTPKGGRWGRSGPKAPAPVAGAVYLLIRDRVL